MAKGESGLQATTQGGAGGSSASAAAAENTAAQARVKVDASEYNPIVAWYREGENAVRETLESYDVDELKTIIRVRHLDPRRSTYKTKNREKLINQIMVMAESRATQGDVFRNYKR